MLKCGMNLAKCTCGLSYTLLRPFSNPDYLSPDNYTLFLTYLSKDSVIWWEDRLIIPSSRIKCLFYEIYEFGRIYLVGRNGRVGDVPSLRRVIRINDRTACPSEYVIDVDYTKPFSSSFVVGPLEEIVPICTSNYYLPGALIVDEQLYTAIKSYVCSYKDSMALREFLAKLWPGRTT